MIGLGIRSIEVVQWPVYVEHCTAAARLTRLEKGKTERRMLRCGDSRCQGLQPIGHWIYSRRTDFYRLRKSACQPVTHRGAFLLVLALVVMADILLLVVRRIEAYVSDQSG